MKAEFDFDTSQMVEEISKRVINAIKVMHGKEKEEKEFTYTVKTLAEYLNVSDQWIYERITRNEIPYIKVGKFPRFKKNDIDKWLDTMKIPVVNGLSRPILKSK